MGHTHHHNQQHAPQHVPHLTPQHMQHTQQQQTMPRRPHQSNLHMAHTQSAIPSSGTGPTMDRPGKWRNASGSNVGLGNQKWKPNHTIHVDNVVNPNFNKKKEPPIKRSPAELRQSSLRQPMPARSHPSSSGPHKKFVPQFDHISNSHFESRPSTRVQHGKIQNELVEKEKKRIPPRPIRYPEATHAPNIKAKNESNVTFKPDIPSHLATVNNRLLYDYTSSALKRNQGIEIKKEKQDLPQAIQNVELVNTKIDQVVEENILANQTPCIPLPSGNRNRKILTTTTEKKEIISAGSQSGPQKSAWNIKPTETKSAWGAPRNTAPASQKSSAWGPIPSRNSAGKDQSLAENTNNARKSAWPATNTQGKIPQTENRTTSSQRE